MPRGYQTEGYRDRNDSIVIAKGDGGIWETDKIYQEFGELHADQEGISINLQEKVPVYEPTKIGRPPVQRRKTYYVDEEQAECAFDPHYIHGKLYAAYNQSVAEETLEAQKARDDRRKKDTAFIVLGVLILVMFVIVLPAFGWSLNVGSEATDTASAASHQEAKGE